MGSPNKVSSSTKACPTTPRGSMNQYISSLLDSAEAPFSSRLVSPHQPDNLSYSSDPEQTALNELVLVLAALSCLLFWYSYCMEADLHMVLRDQIVSC